MKLKFRFMLGLCVIGIFTFAAGVRAAEANWLTGYDQALEQAKQENKKVLIDFTGSDWCGWCIKLHEEVFSQKEFIRYAEQNLVLLELDFPRKKAQSDEVKAANRKLAQQYGIKGFPTVIVLDSEGKQIGQLGYQPGGPKAFIKSLKALK